MWKEFRTDYSNASRTQLFNIKDLVWDKKVCDLFEINIDTLPEVCDSNSYFGETDFNGYLNRPIPIQAVLGDSHELYLPRAVLKGYDQIHHGTGSSVMMNIGNEPIFSESGLEPPGRGMDGKATY